MYKPEEFKHEVVLPGGKFVRLHIKSGKWYLFDRKDRVLGKFNSIKEAEDTAKED